MFHLLKFIIWMIGTIMVAGFVLNYFGYEINRDYFNNNKSACQEKLRECQNNLLHQGIDNAQCDINCINPKLIIKKK